MLDKIDFGLEFEGWVLLLLIGTLSCLVTSAISAWSGVSGAIIDLEELELLGVPVAILSSILEGETTLL